MHPSIPRGLTLLVLCLAAQVASAQPQTGGTADPAPPAQPKRLELGDAAPALDIAKWVKGPEVKTFEKGKIYVVEFWATWCAPCRANIPHLTELQARYAKRNVTVIGVSTDQGADALEKVKALVDARGAGMAYTVALDAGGTSSGYMAAVGAGGIPYAFVVDQSAKVIWHGYPNMVSEGMDLVIEEAADGKFDLAKHKERTSKFRELDQKYGQAVQAKDWDAAEKTLDEIVQIRPDLTGTLAGTRFGIISSNRNDPAAAMAFAAKALDTGFKNDPDALVRFANVVVGTNAGGPKDRETATRAARMAVDATKSKNGQALVILSYALEHEGKYDEAIAAAKSGAATTQESIEQRYFGDRVRELEEAKERAATKPKADEPKPDASKPAELTKP